MSINVRNWGEEATDLHERLVYIAAELLVEYVPAKDGPDFMRRLRTWLNCAGEDDDRRQLFSLLRHLHFVGQRELDVLYRQVFRADVMWWLAPEEVRFSDPQFRESLSDAIDATWFCPVTDSMNIAHFHHVNGIRDRNLRPEWRALAELGDEEKVRSHMEKRGFTRLVLLKDFVGTGNQARDSLTWTIEHFPQVPFLFCPLIICRDGLEELEALFAGSESAELRPGLILPERCEIGMPVREGEPSDFGELRALLRRLDTLVNAPGESEEVRVYGFGAIGALTVMFTNCPNNAPPALHHDESETWSPLFPRAIRL